MNFALSVVRTMSGIALKLAAAAARAKAEINSARARSRRSCWRADLVLNPVYGTGYSTHEPSKIYPAGVRWHRCCAARRRIIPERAGDRFNCDQIARHGRHADQR